LGWVKVDGKWVSSKPQAKLQGFGVTQSEGAKIGIVPDVKKITKGMKLRLRSDLAKSADIGSGHTKTKDINSGQPGSYIYSVKGSASKSVYPKWVKPDLLVVVMSSDSDYWVRCHLDTQMKTTWYFPYTDLVTTGITANVDVTGAGASIGGSVYTNGTNPYAKPPPPSKPKPFVSQLPEAEKLVQEMLQLAGQCATDLRSTATLKDPYKDQKAAMAWSEQVNSLQAQLVGWSMDLQERLEDAQLAIEKEEFEEIRKNATLDFFAGDADY